MILSYNQNLPELQFPALFLQFIMDFQDRIREYREGSSTQSPIWIWFVKTEKTVTCQICKSNIATGNSSSTNLITHLKRHHGFLKKYNAFKEYEELSQLKQDRLQKCKRKNSVADSEEQPKAKQQRISDSLLQPYPPSHPRHQTLVNAVGMMICTDGAPTSIVERPGFKHMATKFDSRFKLPDPTTFAKSVIPKLKNDVHSFQLERIRNMLSSETSMAFSTDGLDGRDAEHSAIYDFCIYFYENTEICAEVIYVKGLESPCTGEVIANFLQTCLSDIEVLDKEGKPKIDIWGITDEGSNVLKAMKILKDTGVIMGYHNCWNHKLQNAIKDAIKISDGIDSTLTAFKKNAATYSRCKNMRSEVRKIADLHNVSISFPQVPNATRWFGSLYMAETFLKHERVFKIHIMESDKMRSVTNADWKKLHCFVDVLQPFKIATKQAEGEKYLTLASIIPMQSVLREKTTAYLKNPANQGYGQTFAKNMLASLEDRFGHHPNYLLTKPYCFATFSDPRYSCIYFKESFGAHNVRDQITEMVKTELESMEEETSLCNASPNSTPDQEPSFWAEFDKRAGATSSQGVSVDAEIAMWTGVSRPHKQTNPIHAMEGLRHDYPQIYKLFWKYSIFPATQNKDERLFSLVGRNTGPQSRSIKVQTIEKKSL